MRASEILVLLAKNGLILFSLCVDKLSSGINHPFFQHQLVSKKRKKNQTTKSADFYIEKLAKILRNCFLKTKLRVKRLLSHE